MVPKIKICGIKTLDEIQTINLFPVDYVGFVFAPSKRQISVEQFITLKSSLRRDIKTVGVFVNENISTINEIVKASNLDIVQLHGDETNMDCTKTIAPVWKSIAIRDTSSLSIIDNYTSADGILLDTYSPVSKGGTGKTFNWKLVENISLNHFVVLAGGLNEYNVASAIMTTKPHVIDVSSGVEKNNRKDKDLITKFIRRVTCHEHK